MSDSVSPVDKTDEQPPLEQLAAGVTTALILLVAFGLLAFDVGWFWVIFPIGFGGVLPAVLGAVRYYEPSETDTADDADDPLETLKQQYARGEIDETEFERRLEQLLDGDAEVEPAVTTAKTEADAREAVRE